MLCDRAGIENHHGCYAHVAAVPAPADLTVVVLVYEEYEQRQRVEHDVSTGSARARGLVAITSVG